MRPSDDDHLPLVDHPAGQKSKWTSRTCGKGGARTIIPVCERESDLQRDSDGDEQY